MSALMSELVLLGHDKQCTWREACVLVEKGCILTEHQRAELHSEDDLVRISPSGFVHLKMASEPTYLAACAEDSWVSSRETAERITERIGGFGPTAHFSPTTSLLNARDFAEYLLDRANHESLNAASLVDKQITDVRKEVAEIAARIQKAYEKFSSRTHTMLEDWFPKGAECLAEVAGTQPYGVFVKVDGGPKGLIHVSELPGSLKVSDFTKGQRVAVRVERIEKEMGKLALSFVRFE